MRGWEERRSVGLIAECGSGKTLISLGAVFAHAQGQPFTGLAMVPPQLVEKWCRETFQTLPCVRVFVIDGVRNGVGSSGFTGVNEVRYRGGRIVREGLRTILSEMRLRRHARSARVRWNELVRGMPSLFVCGRDRGKLSYSWEHAFKVARSGSFLGSLVNVDTGEPVIVGENVSQNRILSGPSWESLLDKDLIPTAMNAGNCAARSIARYGRLIARAYIGMRRWSLFSDIWESAFSTTGSPMKCMS